MINMQLIPENYLKFLKSNKVLESSFEMANDSIQIILYPVSELMTLNSDTLAEELMPNFLIFGSNGGGTAFAFHKDSQKIYAFEFIGMNEKDAVVVANSFLEFLDLFKKDELEIY